MLKHAPAHSPVMDATSDRPSGSYPIRIAEGHILGHLGVCREAMTTSPPVLERLGSVTMVIELQDVTSTSMQGPNGGRQEAATGGARTRTG